MHDCQKFREDWVAGSGDSSPGCEDCRRFCEEAGAVLAALDASERFAPPVSEQHLSRLDAQLRTRLIEERAAADWRASRRRWIAALATAACVTVAVTWGGLRFLPPVEGDRVTFVDDHITGLDPRVVTFLGQSEQFLRDFTKIDVSHAEDIEDARVRASRSLAMLNVQKDSSENFAPVRIALDEYESVLREIKNMDSPEAVVDIRSRIQRNGLIANFKAYQPRAVLVSRR